MPTTHPPTFRARLLTMKRATLSCLPISVLPCTVAAPIALADRYDFLLRWTPLDASGNPIETTDSSGNALPLFFPALEQELGLKLEHTKSMIEVFVIDSAQQPSSN